MKEQSRKEGLRRGAFTTGLFSCAPLEKPKILSKTVSAILIYSLGLLPLLFLLYEGTFVIFTWIISGFVAFKFLVYYYGAGSGTGSATFKRCKEVNGIEQSLDLSIAISGASLIWLSLYSKTIWLVVYCNIYILNFFRCYFTYRRPLIKKSFEQEGKRVPRWYDYYVIEKVNDCYNRGSKEECYEVKNNLKRWLTRDTEYIILCLPAFLFIYMDWPLTIWLGIMMAYYLYKFQKKRGFMEIIRKKVVAY
jgi:hypothetical protein